MKKITVVLLTYNHEKFIRKALKSILDQETKYSFEILIGDDCSPDETQLILKEFKEKYPNTIKLINRKENIGVRENFLDLLSKATGEYIALLEGDDYWKDRNKLEKMVLFLETNKEYIGAFHNIEVINKNDEYIIEHPFHKNNNFSDINSLTEHYEGKIMMTLSIVFRNVFLNKKNLEEYREMLDGIKYVCDYNLKVFLLNFGKFKYFDDIFGCYRFVNDSGSSWSAQEDIVKQEDFLIIYKKNIEKYGKIAERYLVVMYIKLFVLTNIFYIKNRRKKELINNIKNFKYKVLLNCNLYPKIVKKIIEKMNDKKG